MMSTLCTRKKKKKKNAKWANLQQYRDEDKYNLDEIIMMSTLY